MVRFFGWQEEVFRLVYKLSKDSYVYLKDWLWNICSIYPSVFSLASFITCFSYSVGNFIACLKFYTWNACHLCVNLSVVFCWIMVIMLCISSFLCLWFSVYLDLWMHSLLSSNFSTKKPWKTLKTLFCFIEIVLACYLVA